MKQITNEIPNKRNLKTIKINMQNALLSKGTRVADKSLMTMRRTKRMMIEESDEE